MNVYAISAVFTLTVVALMLTVMTVDRWVNQDDP